MTAPTRWLNYPPGAATPAIVGPDMFGGFWRGVTREVTETGVRVGLLPVPPDDVPKLMLKLVAR